MTGIDATANANRRPPLRRVRLPASRGGVAWLAVLLIVGVLLAVQFGRQIYANWDIGQRAAQLEAEIAAVDLENQRLEEELNYLLSDAFVSAEARRLATVGQPGERVLIIPPGAETPLPADLAAIEAAKPLLQQWVELFFGPSD